MLQLMATPFAILTLYLEPPHAFATLFAYYFFGKTLFAYYFFGNNPLDFRSENRIMGKVIFEYDFSHCAIFRSKS